MGGREWWGWGWGCGRVYCGPCYWGREVTEIQGSVLEAGAGRWQATSMLEEDMGRTLS